MAPDVPSCVRFTALGTADLRAPDGTPLSAILVQPKRLAVLVRLAVLPAGGFLRRDVLLALLWPELDEARARNALNKAVHHIRQALGDGVLVGRGDEELGLSGDRLHSDVAAFDAGCALSDWDAALGLYRGELLPGFHVADAPGFEEWLESERERLRRQAAIAATRAAERRTERGDTAGALAAARRAVELAADDEPAVRRLMLLLDQQGDRAGALRAYEDFSSRLEREFGVVPGAETNGLRDQIVAREDTTARRSFPASTAPIAVRSRGPLALVLGLAALALAVTGLSWFASRRGPPDGAPASPHTFAILPFATTGPDSSLVRIGRDLMVLVSARVSGIADIEVIDPIAVLSQADARAADNREDRLRSALHSLGATQILQGSLIRIGDSLRIDARLFGPREGRQIARVELTAPGGDLVAVADSLVLQLVGQLWPSNIPFGSGTRALSTRSLPALRAFLDGERLLGDGRLDDATERYGAAIAADSSFWYAYWRYLYFRDDYGRSMDSALAARLREHRAQLPEPEQTLVEARFTDSLAVKRRLLAGAATRYQSSWDAWFNYADFLYHWGAYHGGTLAEAHQALERTVALNPGFTNAWDHLFRASLREGDTTAASRALQALERLHYDSTTVVESGLNYLLAYRWWYATLKAGGRPQLALSDSMASVLIAYHGPIPIAAFDALPLRFGLAEAQVEFSERVLARSPSRVVAESQMRGLALAWATRGAWDSALVVADRYASGTSLADAALFRYRLAVIGAWLGGVAPAEAQRRRGTLAQTVTGISPDAEGELAWLDGVLAATEGNVGGIERARLRVRVLPAPMGRWLDGSLAGLALSLQGKQAEAIAALAKVEGERYDVHPFDRSNFRQPFLTAVNRMALSRELAARGDTVEALRQLRWVEAYIQHNAMIPAHTVMPGLVDLERARLEDASGQAALARQHFGEFLRRYDMPVPAHQRLVSEARAALAGLERMQE